MGAERDGARRRHARVAGHGLALPARGLRDGDPLRRARGQLPGGLADRLRRPRALLRPGRVGDRRGGTLRRGADRPLRPVARLSDAGAARRPGAGGVRRRRRPARLGLGTGAVRDQQRAARRARGVRALLAVPRPRVRGGRQERDAEHRHPAGAGERQLRPAGGRAGRRDRPVGRARAVGARRGRRRVTRGALRAGRRVRGRGRDAAAAARLRPRRPGGRHQPAQPLVHDPLRHGDDAARALPGPGALGGHAGLRAPRRRGVGRRRAVRCPVAAAGRGRRGAPDASASPPGARATRSGCAPGSAACAAAWGSARRSRRPPPA